MARGPSNPVTHMGSPPTPAGKEGKSKFWVSVYIRQDCGAVSSVADGGRTGSLLARQILMFLSFNWSEIFCWMASPVNWDVGAGVACVNRSINLLCRKGRFPYSVKKSK